MNLTFRRLGLSELLPRYLFAETLFARRRVLEVGAVASTAGTSAKFLVERGARWVVACDESLEAVEGAQRALGTAQLRFRTPVFDDLEPNSFDLVVVADLAPYVRAPKLLEELLRLVAHQGYLVGGLRNIAGVALAQLQEPDSTDTPPTLGQLLDLLQPHYPSVEVATQSPVLAYQLAFQSAEGLQVDGTLAETGESAYWVVFAGQQPMAGLDPTWVQLPPEPLAYTAGRLDEFSRRSRAWEERCSKLKGLLSQARADLQEREAEIHSVRGEHEKASNDLARLTAQLESVRTHGEYARDRDELALRIRRVEAELQIAQERAQDAEGRVSQHRAELGASQVARNELESQLRAGEESLRLERARREEQGSVVEDARTRLTQVHEELRQLEDQATTVQEEREQAKLARDRAIEHSRQLERELTASREREVRLAEQQSTSLSTIEHWQSEASTARREAEAAVASQEAKEAEFASALRGAQADAELVANAKGFIERERAEIQHVLRDKDQQIATLETDLISARSTAERALAELERLRTSEIRLRGLSEELEQKLGLEREEKTEHSNRIAELEAQIETERARAQRLERDVETAIAAQRSSRDQAEEQTTARIAELETERNSLFNRITEFESVIQNYNRARVEDSRALEQLTAQIDVLTQAREQFTSEIVREREAWASERETQVAQYDQLVAAMDTLRAEQAGEIEALRAQRTSEIELEQARTTRANQGRDRAIFRAEQAELRLAELDNRVKQLEQSEQELQSRLQAAESSANQLQSKESARAALEFSLMEQKVAALERERQEADAVQQRLQEELDLLRQAHEEGQRDRETTLVERDSQVAELRSLVEGYESEIRGITEDRDRIAAELERLESSRSEFQSEVEAYRTELDRLQAAMADRDARLELFQRRLNAQETELSVLRRALGRGPTAPVQQIYERASAEISAVKAELHRRTQAATPPSRTPSAALDSKPEETTLPGGSNDKPE